jgi:hypothetical protein
MTEPNSPAVPAPQNPPPGDDFSAQAAQTQPSLIAEFVEFLRYNKAWWLTPIILVLLLVGGLLILGGTAAAPFIYTIF